MIPLIRRHPFVTSLFAVALALTLFFAGQFVQNAIYWSDPANRNQQVQPWMTVGYISRSWDLHGPDIDAEAGLPRPDQRPDGRPVTLQQIADERGVPVEEIIADVQAAILRLKARETVQDALDP
jgi:hypothetical protein